MTEEDLKEFMHKADLIMRPNIVYINPKDKKVLLDALPDIERDVVLQTTDNVEVGKPILVDRVTMEQWKHPELNLKQVEE